MLPITYVNMGINVVIDNYFVYLLLHLIFTNVIRLGLVTDLIRYWIRDRSSKSLVDLHELVIYKLYKFYNMNIRKKL